MDLRASSKFRQTTTGAQLRRRREGGPGLDDRYNTKTFSRQLNHYQTQVTQIYGLLFHSGLICATAHQQVRLLSLCRGTVILIISSTLLETGETVSIARHDVPCVTRDVDNLSCVRSGGVAPVSGTGRASRGRRTSSSPSRPQASTQAPPADPP